MVNPVNPRVWRDVFAGLAGTVGVPSVMAVPPFTQHAVRSAEGVPPANPTGDDP
jgi:hypothetical protein